MNYNTLSVEIPNIGIRMLESLVNRLEIFTTF
jgi:hypothetical protein